MHQYQDIFKDVGKNHLSEENIITKEFGSNCTFIGLNNYIPNRVFTSVTGPVFCRPNFSIFRRAMLYSGASDIVANYDGELYFFPIPDYSLRADSSLILNWINQDMNIYNFSAFNRLSRRVENLGAGTIRNWILNHVGTPVQFTSDNKELILTLRGNYITWDHSDNTIRGTRPSTFGYNGNEVVTCTPGALEEPADNGKVWSVNYWFKF